MLSTLCPSSRWERTSSWYWRSWERHDLLCLNPCWLGFIFSWNSRCLTRADLMILSRVFIICDVSDTGRKFTGVALDPPLWIGMMKAVFNKSGMDPLEKSLWKIISKPSTRLYLHFFRRMEGIPSGPAAELFESLSNACNTSSLSKTTLSSWSWVSSTLKKSSGFLIFS